MKAVAVALERAREIALSTLHVALLIESHTSFSYGIHFAGFRRMIFVIFA